MKPAESERFTLSMSGLQLQRAAKDAANASKLLKIESFVSANKVAMEAIKEAADSSAKVTRNEFNLLLEMVQRTQDHVVALHKLVNKSGCRSHSSTKKSQEKSVPSKTLVDDAPMYLEDETHADDPYDSDYGESAKPKKKKAKTKKETQAQPVQAQVAAQQTKTYHRNRSPSHKREREFTGPGVINSQSADHTSI